jgi:tetratricopeptide (TPR) repeat protein
VTDVLERIRAALADRYRIERELGSGGTATVYLARDLKHSRQVAIKVLRPELAAAIGPERFLQEIEIAARLQHPHILTLIDSGEADGLLYYVMPFVEGESLRDLLNRERQLPLDEACRIARVVAEALQYAHSEGFVHRDIKPENIMLSRGHPVVADFGIARAMTEAGGTRLTQTGFAAGTPAYMSPEQASADQELDGRSDVYALGCVLYEMLAGEPPFTGNTAQAILTKHMLDPTPRVSRLRNTVPRGMDSMITRAMAKSPVDRFKTAGEFAESLRKGAPKSPWPPPLVDWLATGRGLALATLTVVLVAAAALVLFRSGEQGGPLLSANRIAVMPFTVRGGEEVSYLGAGMVELLSLALDGAGEFRAVDPHVLLSTVEAEQTGELGPAEGASAAARLGAGSYVLGSVVQAGERLEVSASLYLNGDGEPVRASAEAQDETEIPELVDELARQIIAGVSSGAELRLSRQAALMTPSFSALRAYLEGEHAYHALEFQDAIAAFQRAIAEDSTFALAYYRLSQAAVWAATDIQLASWAAERALALSDRLSERERRLLEAFRALERNDGLEAERLYRSIIATYPEELQAWYWLGETQFHFNFRHGRRLTESRVAFERASFLSPRQIEPLIHFAQIAAAEGNDQEADSLAGRLLELDPAPFAAIPMRALRAVLSRDTSALRQAEDELRFADDATRFQAAWTVSVGVVDVNAAERLNRFLASQASSAEAEAGERTALSHVLLAKGQRTYSRSEVGRARSLDYATGLSNHALLSVLPFSPEQPAVLRALRDEMESWDAAVPPRETMYFVLPASDEFPKTRLYLLGLLCAQLGDFSGALQHADALERASSGDQGTSLGSDLALGVRAEVARLTGQPAVALGHLERVRGHISSFSAYASPFAGMARERFLRAELLAELGRDFEALNWYATIGDGAAYDFAYLGPAHLGQAQIHYERGNREQALEHYGRFVELWSDGDPEFEHMLSDARARIAELESAP